MAEAGPGESRAGAGAAADLGPVPAECSTAEAEALGRSGKEAVAAYVAGYETWAHLIARERVTHLCAAPTVLIAPRARIRRRWPASSRR